MLVAIRYPKKLIPTLPKGTMPTSIRCPESLSHASEPTAMPTENSASKKETAASLPLRCSLVKLGN
ncbi:Uncharacterised protein [Vibrio cholerae]|nr:Uncharacterised protein [Vibrio cholerae]CRZ97066.1 Uncharacterised protein [Vibrio cholerae]CSA17782.1 Uncharacterised protein [Vibrio cholerae]CSA82693.1 Uncharacterised protein [Vibrio cholerae]CSB28009.1 Uncharacterised protein [Vibrio cholerae]